MTDVPQYRLLADTPWPPHGMLYAGTVVNTKANPGAHWEPLNKAAEAKMEEWYAQEYPVLDKDGKDTGEKWAPHEKFRVQRYEPGIVHSVEVVKKPAPDDMTDSLSLAEVDNARFKDTDQRPGPEKIPGKGKPADPDPEEAAVVEAAAPAPEKVSPNLKVT